MTVYIDFEYKCHVADDGTMTAVENEFFDGKCQTFIEGYCYVPADAEYNGDITDGTIIFPWVDYRELEVAQIAYEREEYRRLLAQNAEYESTLTEIEEALGVNE